MQHIFTYLYMSSIVYFIGSRTRAIQTALSKFAKAKSEAKNKQRLKQKFKQTTGKIFTAANIFAAPKMLATGELLPRQNKPKEPNLETQNNPRLNFTYAEFRLCKIKCIYSKKCFGAAPYISTTREIGTCQKPCSPKADIFKALLSIVIYARLPSLSTAYLVSSISYKM